MKPGATLALLCLACSLRASTSLYVSPNGADTNPGTLEKPVRTLARAQQAARRAPSPATIHLRAGIYYL